MDEIGAHNEMFDKLAIADLIQFERLYRDQHQWERECAAFHPDSLVRLGWLVGTGAEYVDASRRIEATKKGWHMRHITSPTLVQVRKDRAIAETNVMIIRRARLDSALVDIKIYCHLYSRVERREGTWRILTLDAIYEKDTLIPVNPSDLPKLNWEEVEQGPDSYLFSTYNLKKLGHTVGADLYTTDNPAPIIQLYAEAEDWLNQREHADKSLQQAG